MGGMNAVAPLVAQNCAERVLAHAGNCLNEVE